MAVANSTLLRFGKNDGRKKFYSTGPMGGMHKKNSAIVLMWLKSS